MITNRPANPYIAGDPVSGNGRFIGRTDVLRDVLKALRNPNTNALVLYGQRRIGKTSILLQLRQQLAETADYTPVYFDLQDKAALSLAEVLYQLAQRIAAALAIDLPSRRQFDHDGRFFRDTFLPQTSAKSGGKNLVLLFDEFDVLDSPQKGQAGESFFPYLRGWMSEATGVQFIFVLGRRPDDLSTDTLAAFKQVGQRQVSLMSEKDSQDIIRQSEINDSLYWQANGIEAVWHWTQGHPYLTQLLCSEVWELAHDAEPETPPHIDATDVKAALPKAIEFGANAFVWIWNGLPPAERIVMAAMAEVNQPLINRDELADILTQSGVRLILRELDLAPATLEQWDLLRPVDGGYRFAVPMLKRWVAENKPLRRVKKELDELEPLAKSLYLAAEGYYNQGNLAITQEMLNRALAVNPNHMQSRLLLGRVHLGLGDPETAVTELEPVYQYDPSLGQQDLIGALLALAKSQTDEDTQLTTYNHVLTLEARQRVAWEEKQVIWRRRAETALKQRQFEDAHHAYREIEDTVGLERAAQAERKFTLVTQLEEAAKHEKGEAWATAVNIYEKLLVEFPGEQEWQGKLEHARRQADLLQTYNEAMVWLGQGHKENAKKLLVRIVSQNPDYKDALFCMILIVKNIDINKTQSELVSLRQEITNLKEQLQTKDEQLREREQQLLMPMQTPSDKHNNSDVIRKYFEKIRSNLLIQFFAPEKSPAVSAELLIHPYLRSSDGRSFAITTFPFTIGRGENNSLVIDESFPQWQSVSRTHARIVQHALGFAIEDHGSQNKLRVQRRLTERNLLRNGCQVCIGGLEFTFYDGSNTSVRCGAPLPQQSAYAKPLPVEQRSASAHPTMPLDETAVPPHLDDYSLHSSPSDAGWDGNVKRIGFPFEPIPEGAFVGQYIVTQVLEGQAGVQRYYVQDEAGTAVYLLKESAEWKALRPEWELIQRGISGEGLRPPLAAFQQRTGTMRYYLLLPPIGSIIGNLSVPVEVPKAINYGVSLARGLSALHAQQIGMGKIDARYIASEGDEAYFCEFGACVIPGQPQQYSQEVQQLATMLYMLLTGQREYASQNSLPPAFQPLFDQLLGQKQPLTAEALAQELTRLSGQMRRPESIDLRVGRLTDVGMVRQLNEDSLCTMELVWNNQSKNIPVGVYAVADGMSGHESGNIASDLTIKIITELAKKKLFMPTKKGEMPDFDAWLKRAVQEANTAVYERSKQSRNDMGTTLVLAVIVGNEAHIAHVGNSRAYHITPQAIEQITTDHSLVERLVATGQISREEARHHPQSGIIYRTIGDKADIQIDLTLAHIAPGEFLLLCSDGLSAMITSEQIHAIVTQATTPQDACTELITAANAAGGDDNTSVIIIKPEA